MICTIKLNINIKKGIQHIQQKLNHPTLILIEKQITIIETSNNILSWKCIYITNILTDHLSPESFIIHCSD